MTKMKHTKKALLTSVLSLLLCFTMLLGTTFAWFTDSASSTGNKIVAGTLDVQLLMNSDGSGYVDISDSTSPIFGTGAIAQDENGATLWEPGKTQVAYLAIKNNGTLDLKYTVKLNVENVAKDLYEVMEYAIIPDAQYDSVTAWNGGNTVKVGSQAVSGDVVLATGAVHYFALAIHMDEEAGNDYQGGEVNFDLTVLATQLASESDSFDNGYDNGAGYYPNTSAPVDRPDNATEDTVIQAAGANGVSTTLPADVLNGMPAEVTDVSLNHSDPVVDAVNKTITYEYMEFLDQNGEEIDLSANTEAFTVTLPAQSVFAAGETVLIYHDGKVVASTVVNADGTISYEALHFCVVEVAQVGDAVASVNGVAYDSVQAAVDAAGVGDTVTFLQSVEQADGVLIADKQITVDLNGKTFTVTTGASTNSRNMLIKGASAVTVKNGTMVAAGDYSSGAYGTVRTEGTANVTLVDLKLYNYRGNGLNIKGCGGTTIAIKDTEIYSQYGGGIESAGAIITVDNVLVEQKGMYTAPYNSMAISVNGGGKVTVNSGTFTTECLTAEEANGQGSSHGPWVIGVLNSGGELIVNGGVFKNDNFGDNALATAARGMILADTGAKVTVNGGDFEALGKVVDIQNNLGDAARNPVVTLCGGTFSSNPTNGNISNCIVMGNEKLWVAELEDGSFTVTAASGKVAYRAYVLNGSRQAIQIDMEKIHAEESLVIELWSGDTLLTTTTYAGGYPYVNEGYTTCCVAIKGGFSSWDTVISEGVVLSDSNVPDMIKVYADGILTHTFTHSSGTILADKLNDYLALSGVEKTN